MENALSTGIAKKNSTIDVNYLIIDFLIYVIVFIAVYSVRTNHFDITDIFYSYLIPHTVCGAIATLLTRKFSFEKALDKQLTLRPFFYSFILMVGLLSAYSFFVNPIKASRFVVVGSLFISFIIELIWVRYGIITEPIVEPKTKVIHSKRLFLMDLILLLTVIVSTFYFKIGARLKPDTFYLLIIGILIAWFISFRLTHKFEFDVKKNYVNFIWSYFKSYILLIALNIFVFFVLRLGASIVSTLLTSLLLYSLWSSIVISFIYFNRRPARTDEVATKLFKATALIDFPSLIEKISEAKYSPIKNSKSITPLTEKLKEVYLKSFPNLFNWINDRLELEQFYLDKAVIIRSQDIYNLEVLQNGSIQLFINLHELNDIRRLNLYFIELNKKLINGAVFIGKFEPINNRHIRFLKRYPHLIAQFFYLFDFIWRRVVPKLPLIQKFYFGITIGKNRAMSMAECFGRLFYCGFEVIDLFEPDNFVFFMAKKVKEPSTDVNPSYGPFFKMKRFGKDGKEIFVYKMRTMHPYSEYLQKFVYDITQVDRLLSGK